jgi:outer membrane protein assembly factor BamE (lipoprotein component of BamABCDE complex)
MPEKEVFTEDIITKAKNLGIYFEKNGKQENEKENTKEKKVIKKTNRNELGPIYEKSEKEQLQEEIDEYIDTKNTCTIDDCLHIIDMAGYEI